MNNLSIIGSFIICSLVLITLLYVHFRFASHHQNLVANQVTETSLMNVSRIMDYDFDKIGYRVTTGTMSRGHEHGSIHNIFVPNVNPEGDPTTFQQDRIEIPTFNPDDYISIATDIAKGDQNLELQQFSEQKRIQKSGTLTAI